MLKKVLFFLFLTCGLANASQLKVGNVGSPTILDLPTFVAKEKGFFAKNGLNVADPVIFSNSPTSFVALVLGEIHFNSAAMLTAINNRHNGAEFYISRPITKSPAFLVSTSSINSVSQLRGKTIAVGGNNDITRMYAEIILEQNGIKPSEVNWFFSGDSSRRFVAISANQIEAAIFFPPFNFLAASKGLNTVGTVIEHQSKYQKTLMFNQDWANKNPSQVQAVLESFTQAVAWIYDPANKQEAINIIAKASNREPAQFIESYDWAIKERIFFSDSSVSKTAVNYFIKVGREWDIIKPHQKIEIEKLFLPGTQFID
jgi:NitT/TauT family transport system substrate-binding protein